MNEIRAGVTLMQDFCRPNSNQYKGYIDYLDRDEVQRNHAIQTFNLFNDYMGNPEKSTGLFTDDKDTLTYAEKRQLKAVFETAQNNESMMWQTVISFDNRWLENNAVYDSKRRLIDEGKLKEVTRLAVNRLLKSEGLEHAVWSAGIHYNTDNIHVHIAVVEPYPMREKMLYKGKEEVRGKFKLSNLEACKSSVVNEIMHTRELNLKINYLIRNEIVAAAKERQLAEDPQIRDMFLRLYESLPNVPRSLIHYNNSIMQPSRGLIDQISRRYIETYHMEAYKEFTGLLDKQSKLYAEAFGTNQREYRQTKEADLMERLGNALLNAVKEYEKSIGKKQDIFNKCAPEIPSGYHKTFVADMIKKDDVTPKVFTEEQYSLGLTLPLEPRELSSELKLELEEMENFWGDSLHAGKKQEHFIENGLEGKYKKYFAELKVIKAKLNSEAGQQADVGQLFDLLNKGEERNPFVLHQMGEMYLYGRIFNIDKEKSQEYFEKAFCIFCEDAPYLPEPSEGDMRFNFRNYVEYRIGKQYNRGWGVEKDSAAAAEYFEKSGAGYARYSLGDLYFYGDGVEQDYKKAFHLYSSVENFPFADLKRGKMYAEGLGTEQSQTNADACYTGAFRGFLKMEKKQPDALSEYQIGRMLYYGQGCDADLDKAVEYLELSAEKKNVPAQYLVSKIYIDHHVEERIPDAIKRLKEIADKAEQSNAQYVLGKLFTDQETGYYDLESGIVYLEMAAAKDNQYAEYHLGKIYLQRDSEVHDLQKGIMYLRRSMEKGNEHAKFLLGSEFLDKRSAAYYKEEGILYMKELAEEGNQFAQVKLGFEYLKGDNVQRNVFISRYWFEKAAMQGNMLGQEMLEDLSTIPQGMRGKNGIGQIDKAMAELQKSMYKEEMEALRDLKEYDWEQEYDLKHLNL